MMKANDEGLVNTRVKPVEPSSDAFMYRVNDPTLVACSFTDIFTIFVNTVLK